MSNLRLSCFRNRGVVWVLIVVLSFSLVPSASMAQQPTATIRALSGTVIVNGQQTGIGTVLSAGDVIETQAGTSVVLELSDGSELQLGENTNIDIAVLARNLDTGARVSQVKLLWGRVRAMLSPGHQQVGSAFNIETPNSLIGVKFSQPDVEVEYDPKTDTSIIAAHTVAVIVTNRRTGESKEITKKQRGIVKRDSILISPLSSKELTIFPKMPPIIRKKPPDQDKSKDKPDKSKDKPDKSKDKPDKSKDKPDKSKDRR